jgi:hypothetical protein
MLDIYSISIFHCIVEISYHSILSNMIIVSKLKKPSPREMSMCKNSEIFNIQTMLWKNTGFVRMRYINIIYHDMKEYEVSLEKYPQN